MKHSPAGKSDSPYLALSNTRESLEVPSSFEERAEVDYLYIISDQHTVHDGVAEEIGERGLVIEETTAR